MRDLYWVFLNYVEKNADNQIISNSLNLNNIVGFFPISAKITLIGTFMQMKIWEKNFQKRFWPPQSRGVYNHKLLFCEM